MKTKINLLLVFFLFALLCITACQNEETGINDPNEQETIVPNSVLANLISNATANSGAIDNILDGTSCFSIELPVTIIVSDVTITIENEDDLEQLEDLFEDFSGDEDFLDFVFPITIIFSDYTQLVIENEEQLENFISECDDESDVIECVNFVYPISFSVFNSEFNLIDTVVIENDEELYDFLGNLEEDENALIVSLNYPVTLEYANGDTVEVNTNQELADAIEAAGEDCEDEDDDCIEDEVALNLVECPWEVFLYTNDDLENLDGPYIFTFSDDGVLVIDGITDEPHTTTWELSETDNGIELNINSFYYYEQQFGNWLVIECDDNDLKFEHLTVNGTGLFFEENCEDDLDCSITDISEILQECPWDFTDGTGNFDNYQMVFNENGDLLIPEGMAGSAIGGAWSLSITDNGLMLTFSELTAFQDSLGGDWLIVECDEDRLEIIRGNTTLILEQDCENDLGCSVDYINANIVECAWELQTNLINSVVPIYVYFTANGEVLSDNNDIPEFQIGTYEISIEGSVIYFNLNLQSGFESLNGQWQIVECEEGWLYLLSNNNYIQLEQDCNLESENIFDCFGDFEIVECNQPNNVPVFNLSANTIGLIDCPLPFTPSFHLTLMDAENNTDAIANTEAYGTLTAQVYLRVEAGNGNYEIFTIYLNTEDCDLFECFQSFDAVIELCDENNDGIEMFDLTSAFANCIPEADAVTYYETESDAYNYVNPIANPQAYTNVVANQQIIYVRVEINNEFEIFTIQLILEDCNEAGCSEEDVDAFLLECMWNVVNYNGSDNLMEWNLDFESTNQIVVIYTATQTIDAMWSTSQSSEGVIVEFSNVSGPNIQAITGQWLVVECEEARLELHRENDILILERNCN